MITQTCSLIVMLMLEVAALPAGLNVNVEASAPGPYYPDLPVLLTVTITNTTGDLVSFPEPTLSSRDNPYNSLELFAASDDLPLQHIAFALPNFSPWKEGIPPEPPAAIALAAGATLKKTVVLSHDWRHEDIKSLITGSQIRICVALCGLGDVSDLEKVIDRDSRIESPELVLPITHPSGQAATALKKLSRTRNPWLVAHPAAVAYITQGGDFRVFEELGRMPGNIPYARYAQMVVAYMMAHGNGLDPNGGRPPQPGVAKLWADQAMKAANSTGIHPEWTALARELELVGKSEDTQRTGNDEPS